MMGRKQKLSGEEWDWLYWRPVLCYLHNSTGVGKKIKRAMNRRDRKQAKRDVYAELSEYEN